MINIRKIIQENKEELRNEKRTISFLEKCDPVTQEMGVKTLMNIEVEKNLGINKVKISEERAAKESEKKKTSELRRVKMAEERAAKESERKKKEEALKASQKKMVIKKPRTKKQTKACIVFTGELCSSCKMCHNDTPVYDAVVETTVDTVENIPKKEVKGMIKNESSIDGVIAATWNSISSIINDWGIEMSTEYRLALESFNHMSYTTHKVIEGREVGNLLAYLSPRDDEEGIKKLAHRMGINLVPFADAKMMWPLSEIFGVIKHEKIQNLKHLHVMRWFRTEVKTLNNVKTSEDAIVVNQAFVNEFGFGAGFKLLIHESKGIISDVIDDGLVTSVVYVHEEVAKKYQLLGENILIGLLPQNKYNQSSPKMRTKVVSDDEVLLSEDQEIMVKNVHDHLAFNLEKIDGTDDEYKIISRSWSDEDKKYNHDSNLWFATNMMVKTILKNRNGTFDFLDGSITMDDGNYGKRISIKGTIFLKASRYELCLELLKLLEGKLVGKTSMAFLNRSFNERANPKMKIRIASGLAKMEQVLNMGAIIQNITPEQAKLMINFMTEHEDAATRSIKHDDYEIGPYAILKALIGRSQNVDKCVKDIFGKEANKVLRYIKQNKELITFNHGFKATREGEEEYILPVSFKTDSEKIPVIDSIIIPPEEEMQETIIPAKDGGSVSIPHESRFITDAIKALSKSYEIAHKSVQKNIEEALWYFVNLYLNGNLDKAKKGTKTRLPGGRPIRGIFNIKLAEINNNIHANYVRNSYRGLAVPHESPYVMMNNEHMKKLSIRDGDDVIVTRPPIISANNVKRMVVRGWDDLCTGIHPGVWKTMFGDYDGDIVYIKKANKDEEILIPLTRDTSKYEMDVGEPKDPASISDKTEWEDAARKFISIKVRNGHEAISTVGGLRKSIWYLMMTGEDILVNSTEMRNSNSTRGMRLGLQYMLVLRQYACDIPVNFNKQFARIGIPMVGVNLE